jgi:hypothetical protein
VGPPGNSSNPGSTARNPKGWTESGRGTQGLDQRGPQGLPDTRIRGREECRAGNAVHPSGNPLLLTVGIWLCSAPGQGALPLFPGPAERGVRTGGQEDRRGPARYPSSKHYLPQTLAGPAAIRTRERIATAKNKGLQGHPWRTPSALAIMNPDPNKVARSW